MFKKLSKKDATKFQFTVSVEDIENFVPPRKEGVSEKKGGFGFGKKKESSSTDNDVSNYSYAIFWKRGSKRSGHSEFVSYKTISSSNKLVINETFKLTGTLFQSGKKFLKKKMDFEVHEKLTSDATSNGEKIASGHIDLADFVNSESEVTSSAEVKLEGMKKGSGTIRLTVSSTCLKDGRKGDEITEVSTYTAESDDGDDATEDDGNSPRRRDKKPAVDTKLLQENEELRDQNLLLQRKIAELESTLSNDDGDSAGLISDLQKERDDLRLKLKNALIECENYKEERDRAISAQQGSDKRAFDEQVKAQTMRQKLQKQLNEVQAKSNDSSSEKELQSLKSELEISVNKLRELEQENSQFKERIEELEKASDKLKTLSDELQHDKQIAETHLKNFQAIHEEEKTIASERISAIEAQLQTTQNELIELQNKRGAERAQLNELVQQVSKLGGLISDSEAMIADESQDSEAQIKSVALNISKLTSDVNDKLSEIDKLSTEARILQEKLDNVTSDTSEQSSHIEKLEQLVSWGTKSLSEKKSGGSDRFEELKESKALADAINAVLAELEEKADTIEKLNIQIAHLNNDITDDVKESAKLRIDLDEKATAVEKLLLQVEELNSQINSKDSSIQDLQQDVAQLQKGIQEKEDEIKNLAADVEELEKLKNSQTEQIKQISNQDDDEFEELQQTNLEMKKRISELQNRIDELELESSLSVRKAQDQIEKLEITIADLRKQLDESSSSEDESDDAEKIKLQQTNARLRDRITELETDNKVLADSIAELETSVNEIKELGAHSAVLTQNSGEVIADLENKYQDLEKKYKDGLKMVKSVEAQEKETTKKLQKAQKLLDDQQVELEERDHELARLRKKLKKLESTDSSSNMQQTITQYMEEEVYPLLSQAIFKNQQQFSHADLAASRLVILKTLLNRGVVARSLLNVVTEDLDNALFNVMLDMPNLTSNDGFLVKMTISVFENFIFENLLTKDEKNDQISFFQRTRQCADICVLQQALVLHSDEMRQMVCPDLSIDEVQVICQKLGLD